VAYLGHIILEHGMAMDPDKVYDVLAVALIDYYRLFIRSYGDITTQLTQLLKREVFS
jgi:hypothetical protein